MLSLSQVTDHWPACHSMYYLWNKLLIDNTLFSFIDRQKVDQYYYVMTNLFKQ